MKITQTQIEELKGKCPECKGTGWKEDKEGNTESICWTCDGTGKSTIEIEKEWVECPKCFGKGWISKYTKPKCPLCKGKGKIPKYKVGDEIEI